jgi:hypothetical protein
MAHHYQVSKIIRQAQALWQSLRKSNYLTDKKKHLTSICEIQVLVLICNSTLVTLPHPLFNSIVAEVVRWNDIIRNVSVQSNQLHANQGA